VCGQRREKPTVRQGHGTATAEHDQVDTPQTVATLTKALTHDTFHAAPVDGPPGASLRNRKPQARRPMTIISSKDHKAGISRRHRLGKQTSKIS